MLRQRTYEIEEDLLSILDVECPERFGTLNSISNYKASLISNGPAIFHFL
jgi:hypothetical protein